MKSNLAIAAALAVFIVAPVRAEEDPQQYMYRTTCMERVGQERVSEGEIETYIENCMKKLREERYTPPGDNDQPTAVAPK